jgi:hypothetical protein
VDDERAELRREIIAELIEIAQRHARGHQALKDQAEAAAKEPMRMRAESNQNAWTEVAAVLREV